MGRVFGRDPVPGRDDVRPGAEILVVGDEVLRGLVADTNGPWLVGRLSATGLVVARVTVLPDDVEVVSREVAAGMVRGAALVVTCGGLGPTADDRTLEAVALACGLPLDLDEDALDVVAVRYARLAADGAVGSAAMTPAREKMAHLPRGAAPVPNLVGTAPGAIVELGGALVVCLPGVPDEMQAMWDGPVSEVLAIRFGAGAHATRTLVAACDDESVLGPHVAAVAARNPGVYVKSRAGAFSAGAGIRVTLDAIASRDDAASAALEAAAADLRGQLEGAGIELRDT